jgi:formate hydrogenlyase transcriptional activator
VISVRSKVAISALGVLGDLASAAANATHRRGLALAVGSVLERELGLVALDLVLPAADRPREWRAISWRAGGSPPSEDACLAPVPPSSEAPKVRRTAGRWSVSVALPIQSRSHGLLRLDFGSGELPEVALEGELLVVLSRIVGMACHGCDLVGKVARLSRRAFQENRQLRRRLVELGSEDAIAAVSPAMREVVAQCELAAPHLVSVLLRGESGTGKELLARYIHQRSERASAPFVAVNCAALPESLIESELFGHEKGAFTGAVQRHIGRFERASGGTLFLDEVAELPSSVQAKLLRVLQERVVERVGGSEPLAIDVRVIAATHQPIEQLLEDGRFRADLYYRLAVLPIRIPPLRDRPEDIPELIRRKLQQMCERMGRDVPRLSRATLRALCSAAWPGNVRELENHLQRALILSPGEELVLPEPLLPQVAARTPRHGVKTGSSLDGAVRAAIEAALRSTRGKLYGPGGAAALLGLKPSTLQSKMVKLGIERSAFV